MTEGRAPGSNTRLRRRLRYSLLGNSGTMLSAMLRNTRVIFLRNRCCEKDEKRSFNAEWTA